MISAFMILGITVSFTLLLIAAVWCNTNADKIKFTLSKDPRVVANRKLMKLSIPVPILLNSIRVYCITLRVHTSKSLECSQ